MMTVGSATVAAGADSSKLVDMAIFLLLLAVLTILAAGAAFGKTPDTHRQISQHGSFQF